MNLVPVIVPGSFVQFPVLFHPSRLVERPLERVSPAAELVLRWHEDAELGVPHWRNCPRSSSRRTRIVFSSRIVPRIAYPAWGIRLAGGGVGQATLRYTYGSK